MIWRDFTDEDSLTGIKRQFGYDEATQKSIIKSWQPNMEDCLNLNTALYNLESSNSTSLWNGRDYVLVAKVPLWLIEKWRNEEGLDYFNQDHQPALLARFNSNEYSRLRTAPGRL